MTQLIPMTAAEFSAFAEENPRAYAREKVESGDWAAEDSVRLAHENFLELLPHGLASPGNHLCTLRSDDLAQELGMLWFAERMRAGSRIAYVYNFEVKPEYRRRGHATRALRALDEKVRTLGLAGVELHVFGQNAAALELYRKAGFQPTHVMMFRDLGSAPR